MRFLVCICIALAGPVAAADSSGLRTPALGFAYDARANRIRPINGLPGAAMLGDPIGQDSVFTAAVISPRQDLALAISAADNGLLLVSLPGGETKALPEAMTAPAHITFSPSGSAAAVWGSRIQILTGLPDSPQIAELANPLTAVPAAIAVSDDGQEVILVSGDQDAGTVWQLGAGGSFLQLPLSAPAVVAYRAKAHVAVAVTRSGDLYTVQSAADGGAVRQFYAGDDQTSDPVAAQFSTDGARAYTANARGTVAAIDLQSGSMAAVSCQCTPSALEALSTASLFRLTEISGRPVMLFDASSSTPRIWFVPADAGVSSDSQRSAQ
jgi:hypothetical protein